MKIISRPEEKIKIQKAFDKLLKDPKAIFAAWANRQLMDLYGRAQLERWQSKGVSEGHTWAPLNPGYAKWKRKRFVASPGGGRKMLIATGNLLAGVLPPNKRPFGPPAGEHFRKVISNATVKISTTVEYADDVDQDRVFTKFSSATIKEWRDSWETTLLKGMKIK